MIAASIQRGVDGMSKRAHGVRVPPTDTLARPLPLRIISGMDNPDTIAAVRRFNRFYTRAIGVLESGHLGSAYSLAETRVLYELAKSEATCLASIVHETGMSRGSLGRIVARLERDGLILRTPAADAAAQYLSLTPAGSNLFRTLHARTLAQLEELLNGLGPEQRRLLVSRFSEIEALLGAKATGPVTLRPPRIGDIGWVVQRHGVLYAREYGWDERFEALCARIVGSFFETFDPSRERGWIAERGGENVGCVFLQKGESNTAKLRLLLVEPSARGLGLGRRLIEACIDQARRFAYTELNLWTQSNLTAARHLYAVCGFELVASWPNREFEDLALTSETWRLQLEHGTRS